MWKSVMISKFLSSSQYASLLYTIFTPSIFDLTVISLFIVWSWMRAFQTKFHTEWHHIHIPEGGSVAANRVMNPRMGLYSSSLPSVHNRQRPQERLGRVAVVPSFMEWEYRWSVNHNYFLYTWAVSLSLIDYWFIIRTTEWILSHLAWVL